MIKANIHEIKAAFSKYLREVEKGERIIICRRNVPLAEIKPLPSRKGSRRPLGLAKGKFQVPPEFFEPLPHDVIVSFKGERE